MLLEPCCLVPMRFDKSMNEETQLNDHATAEDGMGSNIDRVKYRVVYAIWHYRSALPGTKKNRNLLISFQFHVEAIFSVDIWHAIFSSSRKQRQQTCWLPNLMITDVLCWRVFKEGKNTKRRAIYQALFLSKAYYSLLLLLLWLAINHSIPTPPITNRWRILLLIFAYLRVFSPSTTSYMYWLDCVRAKIIYLSRAIK